MKNILPLFIALFLFSCENKETTSSANSDSLRNERLKFVVLNNPVEIKTVLEENEEIWTPTNQNLVAVNSLIYSKLDEELKSESQPKADTLASYFKQYVCYVDFKGDSLVFVNSFCRVGDIPVINSKKELTWRRFDWQQKFKEVSDGGDCYWQMVINFSKKRVVTFNVNG